MRQSKWVNKCIEYTNFKIAVTSLAFYKIVIYFIELSDKGQLVLQFCKK